MDDAGFQRFERPRQRGRPLTYEEKWLVQHVFETFAKKKKEGGIIRIEEEDPYSLTSKYTGVARSVVATISKSVRQTGSVPVSTSPGHRQQPTAIPLSTEGQIREFIFEQHRQGTICHAKHVNALRNDTCGLDVQERTLCNGTCDAWGSVGHGQKIVLVHCERKPKCASKGTIISMKSEKIVNFQSMRDTMLFI